MHVATILRQHNGKVYETHLMRHSSREEGKVKNVTLANLSSLPKEAIELIRGSLSGTSYVGADDSFEIEYSLAHGHVAAVAATWPSGSVSALCSAPPAQSATSPLAW